MATTRRFEFSEGASDKFWSITVEESSCIVVFGRRGTNGQRQDKPFADAAAAQAAATKLIAEKLGKGYRETGTAGTAPSAPATAVAATPPSAHQPSASPVNVPLPPAAAAPSVRSAVAAAPTAAVAAPVAPVAPATSVAPVAVAASTATAPASERRIALDPDDWRYATWRTFPPMPRSEPRPFDQAACCAMLARIKGTSSGWRSYWGQLDIPPVMTDREAAFWMLAFAGQRRHATPKELAAELRTSEVPYLSAPEGMQLVTELHGDFPAVGMLPLRYVLTPTDVVSLVATPNGRHWPPAPLSSALPGVLHSHLIPYLLPEEHAAYCAALRPHLTAATWAAATTMHDFRLFQLAARFGMLDELATALAGTRSASDAGSDHGRSVCVSGFWLGSAQAVLRHARAIGFHPHSTEQARAWLATTEYAGLDELARAAIAEQDKERAAELVAVLALVEAPDAAAYLLQVRDHSRAPAIARQWLERHPAYGLAGLASVIGGSGALAEAAREWALLLRRQGRIPLITAVAASLPAELAARLQTHVIDAVITDHPVYPPGEPAWFAAAAGDLVPSTLPSWADAAALAPIVCSGIRLSDVQVATVVTALVDPAQNIRLLAAVLRHADPLSTDGFAWSLYQRWMADGAPSAHRWAMSAMGLLGGDPCVQKLTPLIRAWPGESQHARAVLGLEVLRQIRTDLALMQLNSIAQKLPFKGLKAKAAEFLEAIAQDKGLTRGELEDRIVPDCDLDERGERSFDFGPRQFSFALGPGLKPVLRDAAGKILSTLPKPTATDDAVKADAAIAAWKLLTKQVADTASVQAARLEQAMVVGRRWRAGDFRRLLIDHPLMIHLVRRLVWEAVPAAGGASTCFRVSDEREVLGVEDDPVDLAAMSEVGLVHPLRMTDSDRGAWSQVFSDYEIAQPFPQLGRPVQYALPDELTAGALTRFTGVEVLAPTLVYGLEKQGWSRGAALDAGGFCEHLKTFPTAACTAIVTYNGNVGMGYIQPEEKLTITGCFLVPGVYAPTRYPSHANRVALRDVDPVVISEVLNDLLLLATRTS